MEITVRKSDLVKELQLVQGIVERKNSIPILSNVLAEARGGEVRISATDLDVSLRCGCAAEVKTEGAITLGAKKLYEIVRSLPESDVRIKVLADSWATIDCERVSFKMAGLPREDFPTLPEGKPSKGVEIPGELLRDLIARTAFAITAEDARYYLAGALLLLDKDGASMVATDGHRLSYAHRKAPLKLTEPLRVLVPRKAIQELARLLETEDSATFQQVDNHLVFSVGGRVLSSKMIEGQFPAFEKVIALTGDKKVDLRARRPGHRHPPGEPALVGAQPRGATHPGRRQARPLRVLARPRRGARSRSPPSTRGRASRSGSTPSTSWISWAPRARRRSRSSSRTTRARGSSGPRAKAATDYRYIVMPMRL